MAFACFKMGNLREGEAPKVVGWVKVAQRDGGSSPTADCACGGLCSLEVNPATEDPPRHPEWRKMPQFG